MFQIFFLPYVISTLALLAIQLYGLRFGKFKYSGTVALVAVILPVVYFFYILLTFSTPAAFIDDYNLLDSFHRMLKEPEVADRIRAFFEQVNEHRFAFERVVMYLIYLIWGQPSPRIQILTGNLFLFGIAALFYLIFRKTGKPAAYFTPVVLLLFSLLFYENAYWGIAAIQNTPLVFFAMLTAYGLSQQSGKGNALGVAAAVVTSFISGSGIAVWIVGAIILLVQKNYRFLFLWLVIAACIAGFYFTFDYNFFPKDRSFLWHYPIKNLLFFFSFLGSLFYQDIEHGNSFRFYPDIAASVVAGSVIFAICTGFLIAYAWRKPAAKSRSTGLLAGTILFLFATGAMLVVSRPINSNVVWGGEYLSQRYLIFAAVLWAATYLVLLLFSNTSKKLSTAIFAISMVFSVTFNLLSYYLYIPKLAEHKETLDLDKWYTQTYDAMLLSFGQRFKDRLFWNDPVALSNLLSELKSAGLYDPPLRITPELLQAVENIQETGVKHPENWRITQKKQDVVVHGVAKNPWVILTLARKETTSRPVYFILRSEANSFIIPAIPERASPIQMLTSLSFWSDNFSYRFREFKFPPGNYAIWVVGSDNRDRLVPENTGQVINLRSQQTFSASK